MSGTSPNAIFKIMKGLPKIPGYSLSAEVGISDELDFLDPNGFSCESYDIQIPNLKGSAVYADSPITDGRTLVSGALENLKETVRLQLNGGTLLQMSVMLSRLAKMRRDCYDFWQSIGQIEPVYIKHQIEGEPGPRYALLYDIEIHVETRNDPGEPNRLLTLTLERENAWRGLAPGDNPKRWTIENVMSGQKWNSTNADLVSGINHFNYTATMFNCIEFLNQNSIDRKNYIDIAAASIPGSAPALIEMDINPSGATMGDVFLARSTKPSSLTNRDGNTVLQYNTFPAVTAALNIDASLVDDTGGIAYPPTKVARQRGQIAFVTTSEKARFTWSTNSATTTKPRLSSHVLRGRYLVFCRCRSTGASASEIQIRLGGTTNLIGDFSLQNVPVQAGTGNTTDWPVVYLGVATIPSVGRATVGFDGRGAYVWDGTSAHDDLEFVLYALRNSGTGALYVADLVFIPFDECCIKLSANTLASTYDSSNYFTHGYPDHVAVLRTETVNPSPYDAPYNAELSGQPFTLLPGVDNRIYLFDMGGNGVYSITQTTFAIRMNIIPRWYGFRDQ